MHSINSKTNTLRAVVAIDYWKETILPTENASITKLKKVSLLCLTSSHPNFLNVPLTPTAQC